MKKNKIDARVLQQYLEGKGGDKSLEQIKEWFSESSTTEQIDNISRSRWDDLPEDISPFGYDEERLYDKIHRILRIEDAASFQQEKRKTSWLMSLTRIAAVLFIPLALYTIYNWRGNIETGQELATAEIFSPLGARTSFTLPDGSSGWLNGGSTLSFPIKFNGKSRTVELIGEAYFNVRENPEKPFEVLANNKKVSAYGTSFNVMAYRDDSIMEVTLETGSIEVFSYDTKGSEISFGKMVPGEKVDISTSNDDIARYSVKADQYTSWKDGKLILRNEPMTKVVQRINRWYNVNIVISDSELESYTYRATFVDENLDEVLKIFNQTSPIYYKELGREKQDDGSYGKRTIEFYCSTK
jgi:transmembrane sensor